MRFLACCVVVVALAGCGGADSVDESDLPDRLTDAIPRLERAGYEVNPIVAGPNDVAVLIVEDRDAAVVLGFGEGIGRFDAAPSVPLRVLDSSGQGFDVNVGTLCGPYEYISATEGARAMTSRVASLARFC
jgi:hypothetical protein